jgi:hypothetical protein
MPDTAAMPAIFSQVVLENRDFLGLLAEHYQESRHALIHLSC